MRSDRKRKMFVGGRWQLERERHRIAETVPPTIFNEAEELGAAISGLMKRLGLEAQHWVGMLESEWPGMVGEAVARHTRPGRMERRKLTVFVDNSMWLSELSRYGKDQLLKNLQARFGADKIESVNLELDPDGGRPGKESHGAHPHRK